MSRHRFLCMQHPTLVSKLHHFILNGKYIIYNKKANENTREHFENKKVQDVYSVRTKQSLR
jgi:hypothetical protein